MREVRFPHNVGLDPLLHQERLDSTDSFAFRNTGVGDPIEALLQKLGFLSRSELSPVGDAAIVIVGHQIEYVFFEVGSRAADSVYLVLPNHLGQ